MLKCAHLHSSPARTHVSALSTRSSTLFPSFSLYLPSPALSLLAVRHGSSFTPSRASRASSRASGAPYRAPKGRPGPNTFHVKEPLPDLPSFRDSKLPPHIARKLKADLAAARMKKDGGSSLVDFELGENAAGEVTLQPIKGKESKRVANKRVKTPLHRALKLHAAQMSLQGRSGEEEEQMHWDASEQAQAEQDAEQFATQHAVQQEREALMQEIQTLPVEQQKQIMNEFEEEVERMKNQQGQQETVAAAELVEQTTENQQADEPVAVASPPARKKRASAAAVAAAKVPVFGIQTVLSYLSEYDIGVTVTKKSAEADQNPLNQDVIVYDVISRFNFADYIVVVKANSARQMRHLAESTYKLARALNACGPNPKVLSLEGRGREDWMLVDAGHIWLYFFNKTPTISLQQQQGGIFGVNFNVVQPKLNVGIKRRGAEASEGEDAMDVKKVLPFANQHTHTVTFSAHSNPFDPLNSSAAASSAPHSSPSSRGSFPSSSSSALGSDGLPFDPATVPHLTASQINSHSWFEPTSDSHSSAASSSGRKKSELNQKQAKEQMEKNELDQRFQSELKEERMRSEEKNGANNSANKVIDVEFRSSLPPSSNRTPVSSSSSSSPSSSDPSLALLHRSSFVHAVLENLEKNYGDLRVSARDTPKLKDYQREDLSNDVKIIATTQDKTKGKKTKTGDKRKITESIEVKDSATTVIAN